MKRSHSLSGIVIAAMLVGAAPLALAQSTPPSQHPQSGAVTHTPPFQPAPPPPDETPSRSPTQTGTSPRSTQAPTNQDHGDQQMGRHDIIGTVESVGRNGIVEVRTDEGVLKVQFPDASQHLKKGEKITLHLSYTVDAPTAPSSM